MSADFSETPDIALGLHDALTTVMGVLLALGIEPSVLAEPLRVQRDAHRQAGRPDAAGVLDSLRDFVVDPELQRQRQMIQIIHKAPPAGRA